MIASKKSLSFVLCIAFLLPIHADEKGKLGSAFEGSLGALANISGSLLPIIVFSTISTIINGLITYKMTQKLTTIEAKRNFEIILDSQVRFSDVIGLDEVIIEVAESVDFLQNPKKYMALGARAPRGVLLFGPPGTGKTLLARAIAGEVASNSGVLCPVVSVSASSFIQLYRGAGPKAVRELFEVARKISPCILFIDEVDALGSRSTDERNREDNSTINSFLAQMDGLHDNDGILVIGATNFPERLDKALLRPKRFDRQVEVFLPRKRGRAEILKHYLGRVVVNSELSLDVVSKEFSERTTGFSPADLEGFVNEAAIFAAREESDAVSLNHLEMSYDKAVLGLKNHLEQTKTQKRETAIHESGHVLMALMAEWPLSKVSIISRGNTLGASSTKEKHEEFGMYSKEELLHQITILQGGYAAEQMMLKKTSVGASKDLQRASKLANDMVRHYGMGDGDFEGIAADGADLAKLNTSILTILKDCMQKTKDTLQKNKVLLEGLTDKLLEHEELSESEIYEIAGIDPSTESHA